MRTHPERAKINRATWRKKNPEWVRQKNHENNRRLKIEVLSHYGDGLAACACCGDPHIEFLGIDHIGGGGGAHRRNANGKLNGSKLYWWLRRESYPVGYRVLCHNCNLAIGMYGYCPHAGAVKTT